MDLDNNSNDLNNVIEDSLNDALAANEDTSSSTVDDTTDVSTDASTEADTTVQDTSTTEAQVPSPGNQDAVVVPADGDEFAKKYGLQSQSVTGRENRIPYSRVKKIVTKAEKDTETRIRKELEGQATPKITEYETKVRDYEGRLERVAQFENILENDPRTFLEMLSKVPAYKEFFDWINQAASSSTAAATQVTEQPYLDHSDMPQPDQVLSDGSKVYSLDGLAKRDEWLARKIELNAVKQAEERLAKRYQPIEAEYKSREEMSRMVPVIEKQIAEARTWDKFTELESKVVEILKANPAFNLERAYMKAYQEASVAERENLKADRNKIRTEVLAEIQKRPIASSSPASSVKPTATLTSTGPKSVEDIIKESIDSSGLRS